MISIVENWKFLIMEIQEQVKLTHELLVDFNRDLIDKVESKDDYIDNLKRMVEDKCFSRIHGSKFIKLDEINQIRAIHIISMNLERIGDYCVNVCRQMEYLTDPTFIHQYDYRDMFSEIQNNLGELACVYDERDLSGALSICKCEFTLDQLYKKNFDRILAEMQISKEIPNLITVVFIFRYLERIGDAMLNIGEALIFAIIGDRIKIRQFEALQQTLKESGFQGNISDIDFDSIWGSRSGCRIGKVKNKLPARFEAQGIFKEGTVKKIRKEEKNLRIWRSAFPRLVPKIFGYYEKDDTASLLIEFLPGCTMDQVILTADNEIINNAFFVFEQTVNHIWETTKKNTPVQTDFMKQLKTRMDSIRQVHPGLTRCKKYIEKLKIESTDELIAGCMAMEQTLSAPFSVLIHGDFNVNNIVYNHEEQCIHYIDLYRSRDADYIQDASVFLISNFRLPVFDSKLRERLNRVIHHYYQFFRNFAEKNGDQTFKIRMALALARSFYTSCRFELKEIFAKEMVLKSHYLMECIINHGKSWTEFQFPEEVLYY